jgi:hypothetical protein
MFKILFATAIIWFLVGGGFTILSFMSFDRLLRQIKSESELAWIELGRPIGFFWIPPGTTAVSGPSFVRGELYRKWASSSEPQLNGGKDNIAKLRWFKRIGNICFIVGLLQLLGSLALLFVE